MGIIEKTMETTTMGYIGYRIWGIWGSYYIISKAISYLLKGDYRVFLSFAHPVGMGPAFVSGNPYSAKIQQRSRPARKELLSILRRPASAAN